MASSESLVRPASCRIYPGWRGVRSSIKAFNQEKSPHIGKSRCNHLSRATGWGGGWLVMLKTKEAYLRRHNISTGQRIKTQQRSKTPPPEKPPAAELALPLHRRRSISHDVSDHITPTSERSETGKEWNAAAWAQRRKQHMIARATGETHRSPSEVIDPTILTRHHSPGRARQREEPDQKSWRERRKETYLATHNAKPHHPSAVAVGTTAVLFAGKLLRRRSRNSLATGDEDGDESAVEGLESAVVGEESLIRCAHEVEPPKEARGKSWKQKRKVLLGPRRVFYHVNPLCSDPPPPPSSEPSTPHHHHPVTT